MADQATKQLGVPNSQNPFSPASKSWGGDVWMDNTSHLDLASYRKSISAGPSWKGGQNQAWRLKQRNEGLQEGK